MAPSSARNQLSMEVKFVTVRGKYILERVNASISGFLTSKEIGVVRILMNILLSAIKILFYEFFIFVRI